MQQRPGSIQRRQVRNHLFDTDVYKEANIAFFAEPFRDVFAFCVLLLLGSSNKAERMPHHQFAVPYIFFTLMSFASGTTFDETRKGHRQVPPIPQTSTVVDLSHNHITMLPSGVFRGLDQCIELDLAYNLISTIEENAFIGLNNLETLQLAFNRLTLIKASMFRGLSHLQTLLLYNNRISRLEDEAFKELTHLEYLALSGNSLTLGPKSFKGLSKLKRLYLNDNKLKTLNPELFADLPRPLELFISYPNPTAENLWQCNTLCWLKQEEKVGTITWWFHEGVIYKPQCLEGDWDSVECSEISKSSNHIFM